MKRKKVLVHGTPDTLQQFFADAVSRDFEIVALLSDEPKRIDAESLDVLVPQNLPAYILKLIDGIILTDTTNKNLIMYFLEQGLEPRKIILWNENKGWDSLIFSEDDDTQVIYIYGLEFHIQNDDDAKFFGTIKNFLNCQWQLKNMSPQLYPAYLAQNFQQIMGKPLDLNKPQTFTEKMQWLKLYDSTPLKSRLADKYLVRRWVADKIGEQYLIPLLGVWNEFDDIDFDELPNQFVLKCNHGSGMNIIVRDKKTFDKQKAREKINAWLAVDYGAGQPMELHYTRINRKIIAEKFIENISNGVIDYKFHCFNGTPKFIQVIGDRDFSRHTRYQKFCDLNYNDIGPMFEDYPHFPYDVPKPKEFKKMKRFAELLSSDFSYVRVDFYEVDGKLLFGEMTFTSDAGYLPHKKTWTYEKDVTIGELMKLPAISPPPRL